jgi:hypothetical protein
MEMINEWKKGATGKWISVQEEWSVEGDHLCCARDEWEHTLPAHGRRCSGCPLVRICLLKSLFILLHGHFPSHHLFTLFLQLYLFILDVLFILECKCHIVAI